MLTAKLAKAIITKSLFNNSLKSLYSTSGSDRNSQYGKQGRQKQTQRELKPYEKLLFSSPIMNINIEMIMAINELRPKATYIIATKNGQFPKQITNSTFNIVECLHYIQGFKYFYKSFPALVQNLTKILVENIEFSATGIYKVNAMKKMTLMLMYIDCLHGEIFSELISIFFIWSLESSIKIKQKLSGILAPLKDRLKQINKKRDALLQAQKTIENMEALNDLKHEIANLEEEIKNQVFKNRFIKEQDFLCGLHYCLERGYYSETLVKQFVQNILQKDNYNFPEFDDFLQYEEDFFDQKPLSNIFNRKALIYSRMYSNAVYRLKILNELKKMKQAEPKFMDFLKKGKQSQSNQVSESTSEESPFIDGQKIDVSSSSQSQTEQKTQYLTAKLIEQSIIPKKNYLDLVNKYLQLLERKDVLCYILAQDTSSQSLHIMQTQFFSYLNESTDKNDRVLTLSQVKSRYLNIFKEIFNIQKNGSLYAESPEVEGVFQVVLRMYDYGDRKEVHQLLKLYERYLVTKTVSGMKSLAPFYVYEKYGYKSNFVASKLFEYINFKYRLGREESTFKEELIFQANDICRYLCLYFKLLEGDISTLFKLYEMKNKPNISKNTTFSDKRVSSVLEKQIILKEQVQFQQAVQIFLNNYNKLISVVYLERQKSGFIGKGSELSFQYLRVKYFSTKAYEQNLFVEGKIPEEDIRKFIVDNNDIIKSHRSYIKNVYQGAFLTKNQSKSSSVQTQETNRNDVQLNFKNYFHCMFNRKNSVLNPLDQISIILDIVETAMPLQSLKGMQFYEDVLVVFKIIFENKKLVKILSQNQTFPQILKKMIRITQLFKGSYKNESNKLFESILNLTGFNLNNFLHTARINIARQITNTEKSTPIEQSFQPYLHTLQLNPKLEQNIRIWQTPTYQINKQNVIKNIRSDILYSALMENSQLQKIIRDQLAKIKTIRPSEKIKNVKFQLNYLEYPYLANVAINKNNELIVVLVRRQTYDSDKAYNNVLNRYYDQCQEYFKNKGNKVIVVSNEFEVRNSLRDMIK